MKKKHYKLLNSDKKDVDFEHQFKLSENLIVLTHHLYLELKEYYLALLDRFVNHQLELGSFKNMFNQKYKTIKKIGEVITTNKIL